MYVVTFVHDPKSGRGFVYLPGRGEDGWKMNVSTILREGQDGHWHHAEREWSYAIAAVLPLTHQWHRTSVLCFTDVCAVNDEQNPSVMSRTEVLLHKCRCHRTAALRSTALQHFSTAAP